MKNFAITTIRLQLADDQFIECAAQPALALGRREIVNEHQIDVDLSHLPTSGASRLHAFLYIEEGGASVQDFNSRNGTHLNGYLLVPMRRYPLRDGDWLTIGRTDMRVSFERAVQTSGDQ